MVIRLTSILVLGWAALALAQPPRAPRCDGPEFRQFDFWVGDWNVTTADGRQAGTNLVTLEEDGCVVHEHWTGAGGSTGQSFNFYDRVKRQWRQLWIDNGGSVLDLVGSYGDGRMAFTGASTNRQGRAVANKLTFFKNPDGTVRQLWESSTDGGVTWSVVFDGLYRKKGA